MHAAHENFQSLRCSQMFLCRKMISETGDFFFHFSQTITMEQCMRYETIVTNKQIQAQVFGETLCL